MTGDLDGRVLTFLQRWADDLPTAREIAASIREDGRAVGAALRRLEKAGKVRRAGGTGYRGSPAWTLPGHIPNPNYGAQPVPIDDHTIGEDPPVTDIPRAVDLPVGSKVIHNGDTITRDRNSTDGWWGPPQGYYMDHEIDAMLAAGATVLRHGYGKDR